MYIVTKRTEDEAIKLAECQDIGEAIATVDRAMKKDRESCVYEIKRVETEAEE